MTDKEILNGNKLIAEFMGAILKNGSSFHLLNNTYDLWLPVFGICRYDTIESGKGRILEYHKSYDWLIPVIEKIKNLRSVVIYGMYREPEGEKVDIILHRLDLSFQYCTIKIEYGRRFKTITRYYDKDGGMKNSVYLMVIEFITWYNKNQKKLS